MPLKPIEHALYKVRYGLTTTRKMFDTHVAVEGDQNGSMDDASDLAEDVRIEINTDTGLDYHQQFISCIGTVYVWKNVPGPP